MVAAKLYFSLTIFHFIMVSAKSCSDFYAKICYHGKFVENGLHSAWLRNRFLS